MPLYDTQSSLLESVMLVYLASPRLVLILSCGLVFVIYYLAGVAKRPILACRDGKLKKFLLEHCEILQQTYWPTLWCFGTHAQTAIANMLRGRLPDLPYQREILKLKDGGIASLDWLDSIYYHGNKNYQPIALFLPGMTGCSQTEYVKSLVPVAQKQGCRCVVFNNRGRGGIELLTPRTYCACNTEDLKEVLEHIRCKYPNSPIFGTGISLGGIILGHYLVETGAESVISAALLISVAWDIPEGSKSLEKPGLNLMLNRHLAQNLCDMVRPFKSRFQECNIDMNFVLQSRTIREFDDRLTTKLFGFDGSDHYYTSASLKGFLNCIKVPSLCVNAADDMFAPYYALPRDEASESSHVAMVITSRGGHIGFMEGFLPAAPFFSERLCEQYIRALVSATAHGDIKKIIC